MKCDWVCFVPNNCVMKVNHPISTDSLPCFGVVFEATSHAHSKPIFTFKVFELSSAWSIKHGMARVWAVGQGYSCWLRGFHLSKYGKTIANTQRQTIIIMNPPIILQFVVKLDQRLKIFLDKILSLFRPAIYWSFSNLLPQPANTLLRPSHKIE